MILMQKLNSLTEINLTSKLYLTSRNLKTISSLKRETRSKMKLGKRIKSLEKKRRKSINSKRRLRNSKSSNLYLITRSKSSREKLLQKKLRSPNSRRKPKNWTMI